VHSNFGNGMVSPCEPINELPGAESGDVFPHHLPGTNAFVNELTGYYSCRKRRSLAARKRCIRSSGRDSRTISLLRSASGTAVAVVWVSPASQTVVASRKWDGRVTEAR
jgi:hypothetical protein